MTGIEYRIRAVVCDQVVVAGRHYKPGEELIWPLGETDPLLVAALQAGMREVPALRMVVIEYRKVDDWHGITQAPVPTRRPPSILPPGT